MVTEGVLVGLTSGYSTNQRAKSWCSLILCCTSNQSLGHGQSPRGGLEQRQAGTRGHRLVLQFITA